MSNLFSQTKLKLKNNYQINWEDETIDYEIKIAKIFDECFVYADKNLGILTEKEIIKIIIKTTQEEVLKVIRDWNTKKSCQTSDTPTKIIKLNSDILSNLIYNSFNYCIDKAKFPNDLKYADIVPIYKKSNMRKRKLYTCKHPILFITDFMNILII